MGASVHPGMEKLYRHNQLLESEILRLRYVLDSLRGHVFHGLRGNVLRLKATMASLRETTVQSCEALARDMMTVAAAVGVTPVVALHTGVRPVDKLQSTVREMLEREALLKHQHETALEDVKTRAATCEQQLAQLRATATLFSAENTELSGKLAAVTAERDELKLKSACAREDFERHIKMLKQSHREREQTLTAEINMLSYAHDRPSSELVPAVPAPSFSIYESSNPPLPAKLSGTPRSTSQGWAHRVLAQRGVDAATVLGRYARTDSSRSQSARRGSVTLRHTSPFR